MMEDTDIPRVFALIRDADESCQVVGYGMVLPDRSTYSISWPAGRGTFLSSVPGAEETAALRGARVLWMCDQSDRASRAAMTTLDGPHG